MKTYTSPTVELTVLRQVAVVTLSLLEDETDIIPYGGNPGSEQA